MLWDITTTFLPVEDLMRSELFKNFDGYSLKNGAAMPLTISNFPRAWQAYFLSNTLQIWLENTSFDNLQMMWNNVFDTSIGFGFEKIWLSRTVHIYSLYLDKLESGEMKDHFWRLSYVNTRTRHWAKSLSILQQPKHKWDKDCGVYDMSISKMSLRSNILVFLILTDLIVLSRQAPRGS